MKRLIITLEYPPQIGGIASYVHNLCEHLPAEEVVVYAPRMKGDAAFDSQNKWKVYRRDPYLFFFWPRWLAMLWQVRGIARQEKITEIYVQHALPAGYVAHIIYKLTGIPYTLFFHGTDVSMAAINSWKRSLTLRLIRAAKGVVVNSQFLKNKLLTKFESVTTPITILYPSPADVFLQKAPDADVLKLKSSLALLGKKVIITVGRMVDGKGYPHLARMLPAIARAVPNVVWLVVGAGEKLKSVEEMIQKNNMQSIVRYIGAAALNTLPVYYQVADVFVLLSHSDETSEEGWGTVFLEAAASGVPVIAGQTGGVAEAVVNNVTGLVVDTHQEKAVVDAVVNVLSNPSFAHELGAAGQERVQNEFTWEKQIKKLL